MISFDFPKIVVDFVVVVFSLNGYWVLVTFLLLNRLREMKLLVSILCKFVIILELLCVVSVVRCHCLPLFVVSMGSLSLLFLSLNKKGLKSSAKLHWLLFVYVRMSLILVISLFMCNYILISTILVK